MSIYTPDMPKSYLSEEERGAILREGGKNLLYLSESCEAGCAGDDETAWAWLRFADLTPQSLLGLKNRTSGQFIRDKGLNTAKADALYGADWLDC